MKLSTKATIACFTLGALWGALSLLHLAKREWADALAMASAAVGCVASGLTYRNAAKMWELAEEGIELGKIFHDAGHRAILQMMDFIRSTEGGQRVAEAEAGALKPDSADAGALPAAPLDQDQLGFPTRPVDPV